MASDLGKMLLVIGLLVASVGLFLTLGGKLNFFARLPGDLRIERENFTLLLPLGTCLLISVLLSLIFWLFRR